MAPLRNIQPKMRSQRSPLKKASEAMDIDELQLDSDDEPPTKRLRTSRKAQQKTRWVPGGRGGGGRRIDPNSTSASFPATPRTPHEDFQPTRPRRRETTGRRTATTSRFSTRRRNAGVGRPRYTTAAAAAAATHNDAYKPREERGWDEYHPDLDLDSTFAVIPSEEVDGLVRTNTMQEESNDGQATQPSPATLTPPKRRPGRPQRSQSSMLQSLLTPEAPKFVPAPGPNPRERLTLPKPSYRILDPFLSYETKDISNTNYVDRSMANVGYQESELFTRPDRTMIRQMEGSADEDLDLMPDLVTGEGNSAIGGSGVGRVEYDMDEQDVKWLEALNKLRVEDGTQPIKPAIFEITMTKIEKEWHALEKRIPKPNPKAPQTQRPRSSSAAAVNGEPIPGEEPDSKCAICDDGDCENANAIVFCDGCDLAVHQECYGVPYIPEGQWLCRKCQLVGNARPSCIFCPNEGGAFKQTNNSKWAHLLCATWIPEVTIGNLSLMEPITDVEKVPNSRWKLGCYICKQDMGAAVQCSDGRCYEPFHLTCARQAGLYLRMKTGGGQNSLMDPSQLRAYCHRHSPPDWKLDHHTDRSFERAKKHLAHHFRGQIWADSKASALAISDQQEILGPDRHTQKITLTNKKGQKPKSVWRLPSGAPVIPEVILKTIEEALVRFTVLKKREYIAEICKYWTLKREARRGAALLKRLQLQMDTFNSFEVTRRDYKAQGAAGRARLERRISFAETLVKDLERLRDIVDLVKQREKQKLEDAQHLKAIVDTVYFPVPALLMPIVEKAIKGDRKGLFQIQLHQLQTAVINRHYVAVNTFFGDLAKMLQNDLGFDATDESKQHVLYEKPLNQIDDNEQRDRRNLARRIMRDTYPLLQDALRKESELNGRPFEQQMKEMDELYSRRASLVGLNGTTDPGDESLNAASSEDSTMVDAVHEDELHDIPMQSIESHGAEVPKADRVGEQSAALEEHTLLSNKQERIVDQTPPISTNGHLRQEVVAEEQVQNEVPAKAHEPPTPPLSTKETSQNVLNQGGIPWYVEQFDPVGTTIYEERWTGKDVLRDMSEELSDMDDDELLDLGVDDETPVESTVTDTNMSNSNIVKTGAGSANGQKKKRKGSGWAEKAFRKRVR